ncbi:MAG: hypothetical protein KAJ52_05570, partial [Sedimentisphaerales bacterium]|nr:hypothetical protein [Sedimentisphaerales bacterium]
GTLSTGAHADITIIDPNRHWTVRVDEFKSKSRNCPYDGWELPARAVYTIVGGTIQYQLTV